ncbi:MAG: hypothetical protein AB1467_05335 [Candidatus Diapherotrites archaeon]
MAASGIVSFSSVKSQQAKIVFVIIIAIVMTSLAVTAFIEGLITQLHGDSFSAFKYYFVSVLCVAAIFWAQSRLSAMLRAM